MPKAKKKAVKKKKEAVEEEIPEEAEDSETIEELEEEGSIEDDLDLIEGEDTSIEEEIIEIGEKKEDLKEFKEIPKPEEEIGEVLEERLYTVPLGRVKNTPINKRAKRAVNMLREFVVRHMKPEGLSIDPELNELIWKRGIEKPPRKIRIRVTKDREGLVIVYPVD